MKCTVHHTDEVISMYQVARMGPQQIAILWQACAVQCVFGVNMDLALPLSHGTSILS